MSLEDYENAVTNDGSPAIYYVQTEMSEARKIIIYLEGGGFCVPRLEFYLICMLFYMKLKSIFCNIFKKPYSNSYEKWKAHMNFSLKGIQK